MIGAGQAGLSTSYHLRRLGIDHVVLDADDAPGGAWQHRWDSLTMHDVHGVAALPGSGRPSPRGRPGQRRAAGYFAAYERARPAGRPAGAGRRGASRRRTAARRARGDRRWTTRTLVNATGTWTRPFVPPYPGAETFAAEQLHTHDYPGPEPFRGRRVVVVGGGASAVQLLGEIAPVPPTRCGSPAASRYGAPTTSPPRSGARRSRWSRSGSAAGCRRPASSASPVSRCASRSARPSGSAPTSGARCSTGHRAGRRPLGRRHALAGRRDPLGHRLPPGRRPPRAAAPARAARRHPARRAPPRSADPRVQLVGYGPSASTIGANRAGPGRGARRRRLRSRTGPLSAGVRRHAASSASRSGRSAGSTVAPVRT